MVYECENLFFDEFEEKMYADVVSYFKPQNPSLFRDYDVQHSLQLWVDDVKRMLFDGAPSVDVVIKRDGSMSLHRSDMLPSYDTFGVVFRYTVCLNKNKLYDVVRYDYRDEVDVQKDDKEEYGVEFKGTTYVFDNVYERDLVESMSRLIKHKGDDVSGTEFGNMIKYVFRLLGVESDWTLR